MTMFKPMCGALALLALSACGSQPATGATPATNRNQSLVLPSHVQTFDRWTVACDNANHCEAFAGRDEDNERSGPTLHIVRDAGPTAAVKVSLYYPLDGIAFAPITAHVGDKVFHANTPNAASDWEADLDPAETAAFLAALLDESEFRLTRTGAPDITAPLTGTAAAFSLMDGVQGRTAGVTALYQPGSRPASLVPAAPELPLITAAAPDADLDKAMPAPLTATMTATLNDRPDVQATCFVSEDSPNAVSGYRLGGDVELWGIGCGSGTMNTTSLFFLTGRDGSDPVMLVLPDTSYGTTEVYNGGYDPATRTMTSSGRSPGNCGSEQTWVWTGRTFELVRENRMDACWTIEPWPSTWRARSGPTTLWEPAASADAP